MVGKRKRDSEPQLVDTRSIGEKTSHIGNKLVRAREYAKLKTKKKKVKRAERAKREKETLKAEELGLEPPPKRIPKTLENTREQDETVVQAEDDEVEADEAQDEYAGYFESTVAPKVLLTTCYKPTKLMYRFLAEMLETLPCAYYYKRQGFALKKIVKYASNRCFTDIMVFNQRGKELDGLLLIHLPDGPTAHFRLSNLVLGEDIKGHGRATTHKPELVLNNFGTRLGRRVGRMFASLFSQDPAFRGRRVVTFHNQRDFVFFRHHRYIFEEKEKKQAGKKDKETKVEFRLQELGPRFTLKLMSLQHGTFDSKSGDFEWVHNPQMDTSRRRFFL